MRIDEIFFNLLWKSLEDNDPILWAHEISKISRGIFDEAMLSIPHSGRRKIKAEAIGLAIFQRKLRAEFPAIFESKEETEGRAA